MANAVSGAEMITCPRMLVEIDINAYKNDNSKYNS